MKIWMGQRRLRIGLCKSSGEEKGSVDVRNITWRNIRVFDFARAENYGGAPYKIESRRPELFAGKEGILFENLVTYNPLKDVRISRSVKVTFFNV